MTSSVELKAKYDASVEKVDKRKAIIKKNCDKIGVNYDALMNRYYAVVNDYKEPYFRSKVASAIVGEFTNADGIDYGDPTYNVIDSLPKLYDLEKVAKNWKAKLDTQLNRENAPKIKVLVEFLNEWGERARAFYMDEAERYVKLLNKFHKIAHEYLIEKGVDKMSWAEKKAFVPSFNDYMYDTLDARYGAIRAESFADPKVDALTREITDYRFEYEGGYNFDQAFGYSLDGGQYVLKGVNEKKLDKVIEDEKVRKYEDLCNRISAVVGEITDVDGLYIGAQNGELNGIVIGTEGKARVETIGAGGYNTDVIVNVKHGQVFHYRVLVHKIK